MHSEIEIATPPNDISPPDPTPVIEIAPTLDDITQPDPTPVPEESPKYFFAHIVRISILAHVVNPFMRKFLVTKLDRINGNKINTNTTFLLPEVVQIGQDPLLEGGGLKINTYADSDWKGNAGILFNEDCHFLGFYSGDLGSDRFDGFDSNGNIEPQIMTNLELWARNSFSKYRNNNAMKRTPNGTIDKLKEIALRRVGLLADDHSSTQYKDTSGNMIYTGKKDKFHKDQFDGWDQIPIPQDRLRHNETHIRANISDINGFFVTKSDWESNSYGAINSLKNLYLATKKKRLLAKDDTRALQTFVDLIKDRVKYYNKSIELITAEKSFFEQ
ncbi:MAG: hypothetical protein EXR06_04270, partial [Rickettsiales bacterium]|nr:hypothetical protein [Rickettsiales bacterium]